MEPVWLILAFVLGFAVRLIGLPPLVGFLAAGFLLRSLGAQSGAFLEETAHLGVSLLLLSIGLKLRPRNLVKPEIWLVASSHVFITTALFGTALFWLSAGGFQWLGGLSLHSSLLLGFALSFSSTVFAVKVLEQRGEMGSLHGRLAIGILIVQDLLAVGFLGLSTGKWPTPWAVLLVAGLIVLRPIFAFILSRMGHGELLILFGLCLAIVVGRTGFELVGVKGDLGALIVGVLLADHKKAEELANSILNLKDLLLVGFFLSIGLSGLPSLNQAGLAVVLALAVVVKVTLFLLLLTRFRFRARTSLLTSLSLANYSEFGLIVVAGAEDRGWVGNEWLIVLALSLAITFVTASVLNKWPHTIFSWSANWLHPLETSKRHQEDQVIDPGDVEVLIFGMGRVGRGAYEYMKAHFSRIVGIDYDAGVVDENRRAGRAVLQGDATDPEFWERLDPSRGTTAKVIMLAMSDHSSNLYALKRLSRSPFRGLVTATAKFDDQVEELRKAGADAAFNFYAEAGAGFAEHVCETLCQIDPKPEEKQ